MSDAVKVELIRQLPAIISAVGVIIAVTLGFLNRRGIGNVEHKVDGKMDAMVEKVDHLQTLLTGSRVEAAYAKGAKDEKESQS